MEIHIQNRKKGFTLAELLVVVAIVAILAAISIPIFTRQRLLLDCHIGSVRKFFE